MPHEKNEDELEAHRSYYSNQKDYTLEDNELRKQCLLDVGRHTLRPICSLGKLDILPPELLTTVLAQLDVQSLTDFRRVNQQAMRFINSIPQYQVVVEHASDALRGMLSIDSAKFSTIEDLYDKLCTATCETCIHFGGYLYLVTCKKVCFRCLSRQNRFLPLSRTDIVRKYGLQSGHMARIPRARSRPGRYSERELICRKPLTLFDQDSARSIGITIHGTAEKMEEYVAYAAMRRWSNFKQKESTYKSRENTGKKPRPPRVQDPWDGESGNRHRFMAIVSVPYFDAQTRSAEHGFYCIGCQDEKAYDDKNEGPDLDWRRKFTAETFIDHMKQWGKIKNGFHLQSSSQHKYI